MFRSGYWLLLVFSICFTLFSSQSPLSSQIAKLNCFLGLTATTQRRNTKLLWGWVWVGLASKAGSQTNKVIHTKEKNLNKKHVYYFFLLPLTVKPSTHPLCYVAHTNKHSPVALVSKLYYSSLPFFFLAHFYFFLSPRFRLVPVGILNKVLYWEARTLIL